MSRLYLTPDEGGGLRRQIVMVAVEGAQGRELGGQVGRYDLEHPLRADEVAQAVLTQVTQADAGRKLITDQFPGGGGEQDLAAVSGRAQAGDAVEGRAEVVAVAQLGCAHMEGRPHTQGDHRRMTAERCILLGTLATV